MNKIFVLCAFILTPFACLADCSLPIDKTLIASKVVDGVEVYVVVKEYVDELECIDLEKIRADLQRIEQLETTLAEYQSLSNSLQTNVQNYRDINSQLNLTLDRSVTLTDKYDQQLIKYDSLSEEFSQLAGRYDSLTEKYRNIALGRSSFISFDAGVGLDENNDVMGLIGVGFKNIKVWGIMQDSNNGVIVGGSLPF